MAINDLASAQKRIAQLEKLNKNLQAQVVKLKALVAEVQDHIDPAKKDVVLAVKQAKSWVGRAVKILKAIF